MRSLKPGGACATAGPSRARHTWGMDPLPPTAAALAPTALIDSDHPAVIAFAQRHAVGADERERAVALTYAVRDGFRYDPYRIDLSVAGIDRKSVV